MNGICLWVISLALILTGDPSQADEKGAKSESRSDLSTIDLSDGYELWIRARAYYPEKSHDAPMTVYCTREIHKPIKSYDLKWKIQITSLNYVPGRSSYYALAEIAEDRIFLFLPWGAEYCTINRRTGEIVERGKGDDILKKYKSLVPLKIIVIEGGQVGYVTSH